MSKKVAKTFVGKRKTAVASLTIKPGKGNVYINSRPIETFGTASTRRKILTPLLLMPEARKTHDFQIRAHGGGYMAIADAAATAVAKALAAMSAKNKRKILEYDRMLLAGDPRRTEPKKPGRRSARRFKQKSYR